jgi:hypothetical protein
MKYACLVYFERGALDRFTPEEGAKLTEDSMAYDRFLESRGNLIMAQAGRAADRGDDPRPEPQAFVDGRSVRRDARDPGRLCANRGAGPQRSDRAGREDPARRNRIDRDPSGDAHAGGRLKCKSSACSRERPETR